MRIVQSIYEWRDVLSINRGSHSIKVGGNIQHNQVAIATVNRLTPGAVPRYSLGTPTEPYGFPLPDGIRPGRMPRRG